MCVVVIKGVLTLCSGKVLDIPRLSHKVVTTKLQPENRDITYIAHTYHQLVYCKLVYQIHVLSVVYSQLGMVYTITDFSIWTQDSLWGVLVCILERVFTHGSGLGVIEGGVWVQVIEVFCCVLSDTQVPNSSPSFGVKFCARHICLICILVFISITVVTVQGVLHTAEGWEVYLTTLSRNEKGFHYETKCEQGVPRIL